MIEAGVVFQQSYEHVMSNLYGSGKEKVLEFVVGVVLRERPYLLLTPQGIEHISELVFTDPNNRDFVLSLAFNFFSRLGGDADFYIGLSAAIARGAGQAISINTGIDATPNQISDRLVTEAEAVELLAPNKWLIVIFMINLFITVAVPDSKNAKTK